MIPETFFSERLARVDMHNVLNKAIEANEDFISDQITNQLDKGLDGDGNDLGEYRNYEYKNRWKPVDLKLTGEFRKSITVKGHEDYAEPTATDPKTEDLTAKFGDAILNLTDKAKEDTGEFIKEDVQLLYAEEVMK